MTTLDDWTFTKDAHGDWIGTNTTTGRRTALKGSLQAAKADAEAGRVVCRQWPDCEHYSPGGCTSAIAAQQRRKRAA